MSGLDGIRRLLFATTAAVVPTLVVAAYAIQLRGDGDNASAGSSVTRATDPVAAELERCRTVTSERAAELQECRRVWTENRRRFLGQGKAPAAPSVDAQPSAPPPLSAQPKDPGRLPQGRPPVATPKSE
jgi:conjugative transfer region protein TrbK